MEQTYRASFQIPEELGKELSDLVVRQSIYENAMVKLIADNNPCDEVEKTLMSIVKKIEIIKSKITNEYVPNEYRSERFMWNYDGYHLTGTEVKIYEI